MPTYKKKKRRRHHHHNPIGLAVVITVVCVVLLCAGIFAMSQWGGLTLTGISSNGTSDEVTYNGKTYVPNDHLSNYLFIGVDNDVSLSSDTTTSPGSGGQADAVFLVSYDRAQKTLTTIAIPRDTMCDIRMYSAEGNDLGWSVNHLSYQYAYGDGKRTSCTLMEDAVSRLFEGVRVDGYTTVNLQSISHLVELVGYVDVTVPDDTLEEVDPEFKQGATVRLTAENAETFVRSRDTDVSQSALARMERQKVFIKAFVSRVRELQSEDESTVSEVYDGLQSYMLTSMSSDIFLDLAEASESGDITNLPGEGAQGAKYDEFHVDTDALHELILQDFYTEK